jgi:phosphate transport system substrate-binding protein
MSRNLWIAATAATLALLAPASHAQTVARGSDSTREIATALAEACRKAGGPAITVEGGGSGKGAKDCLEGKVQIAVLSRSLKDEEKSAGLVGFTYGMDGTAVIVNPANPADNFTTEQLRDIYSGKNTTWPDGKPVMAFTRPADSGTRELFQHAVMGKEEISPKISIKHHQASLDTVSKAPTAIAYTSACSLHEGSGVKVVKINGISPTPETIRSASYPLSRSLVFATKGEPSGEAKAFIDFVLSAEGQKIVAEHKFVTVAAPQTAQAGEGQK